VKRAANVRLDEAWIEAAYKHAFGGVVAHESFVKSHGVHMRSFEATCVALLGIEVVKGCLLEIVLGARKAPNEDSARCLDASLCDGEHDLAV